MPIFCLEVITNLLFCYLNQYHLQEINPQSFRVVLSMCFSFSPSESEPELEDESELELTEDFLFTSKRFVQKSNYLILLTL